MSFPDFEEFVDSLSKEDLSYIDSELPSYKGNLLSPEGLGDFISRMSAYSFGKTLRILELYHGWLSEQLSNQE